VEVRVIIREDRHIGKSRVIQCFPKQSAVMGQAAVTDVLSGGDGMEGGEGDICLRNTLVQQRLDIGLRVNTAAAGDIVDAGSISCQLIHLFRRCLENRSDLVDEGTGSAGTASVHAHVCDN